MGMTEAVISVEPMPSKKEIVNIRSKYASNHQKQRAIGHSRQDILSSGIVY